MQGTNDKDSKQAIGTNETIKARVWTMEIRNPNNIFIRIRNLFLSLTMTAHNFNVTNRLTYIHLNRF